MRFTVLTLFPEIVHGYIGSGVVGRAIRKGLLQVDTLDIRDFTTDKHRSADDVPFGGGAGMVLKPEPVARAIEAAGPASRRVLLSASARPFKQADAEAWAGMDHLVLLCGRYEGVDARVTDRYMDDSVAIGDYVLSGGELGALVVMDATARLVPGVLGNAASAVDESYSSGLLEHPHFTRPAVWRGESVPEVLLSGHHARIATWRHQASLQRTRALRPDLLSASSDADAYSAARSKMARVKESES
jgi:tRNA (guanine37-N1)-methyltransferase